MTELNVETFECSEPRISFDWVNLSERTRIDNTLPIPEVFVARTGSLIDQFVDRSLSSGSIPTRIVGC